MNYDSIEDFLDSVFVRSHSVETVRTYKGGVERFERFLLQKMQITLSDTMKEIRNGDLDPYRLLRDFVIFQDKSGLMPRTIHIRINAVKSYLRHCGIKIYTEDFKQSVKMPRKITAQEIPLTKEIIQRLLRNVSPKLQTVILVAVSSGIRISEMVQIRIGDFDFESEPTRIRLRAETTKTRTARDVFITKEAMLALKDYLRRYHKWDGTQESIHHDKMIFGRTSMSRLPIKDEKDLNLAPLIAAKSLLQKSLENSIKRVPELNMKSVDGKRMIHFHAFRKFFRTTVGNVSGRDFAEALMGHQFYLDTYYQLPDEKKKTMYLDVEPYLTISDFENVEKKLETISAKYSTLDEKFNNLLRYFEKNSISIPEELK